MMVIIIIIIIIIIIKYSANQRPKQRESRAGRGPSPTLKSIDDMIFHSHPTPCLRACIFVDIMYYMYYMYYIDYIYQIHRYLSIYLS